MNLYLLGGNGKKNIEWVEYIEKELRSLFNKTSILRYEHWDLTENVDIDLERESSNLTKLIGADKDYIILAKSAGMLTALKAIKEHKLTPRACVFCGFPLLWAEERHIPAKECLHEYNCSTTFIQNDADPFCPALQFKEILEQAGCRYYQFVEDIGNTHNYNNISLIKETLYYYLNS